ncbi:hypothetical protein BKA24_000827 [Microbacterium marinum]|uniref:BLUF domain-containing protein n=1 Tax=Microbacterium marinum TaxID=421115 RepID=A0A7W7BNW3_9MICO|nr:BLUF domain-containing protein [Microbacterium marinum]MBB4666118.1 hypothetical protein [Microbacterium marinum]
MRHDGLISVLYSSTATAAFDERELEALLAQCRASNADAGVTGMLLYRAGRFFQVLEGRESVVRPLVERIALDGRHHDMRVLVDSPIEAREFAEWTMGYERIEAPTDAAPSGFRDTFADLENSADPSAALRAAHELSLWFRVRAHRSQ